MKKSEYFAGTFPDGESFVLDVGALNAALDRLGVPTVAAQVSPALVNQIRENGIEPEHLERLAAGEPDFSPATMIVRKDLTWIVDGNHRANMWVDAGSRVIPARIAPEVLWRLYLVQGNPHAQP